MRKNGFVQRQLERYEDDMGRKPVRPGQLKATHAHRDNRTATQVVVPLSVILRRKRRQEVEDE